MKHRLLGYLFAALVVIAILLGIMFYATRHNYVRDHREAVLKKDLSMMREAIDRYTFDKKECRIRCKIWPRHDT